jgi:hypothetical protein
MPLRNMLRIALAASALMLLGTQIAGAFNVCFIDADHCKYGPHAGLNYPFAGSSPGGANAGGWGCRAINGVVGGRSWGAASRDAAASRALEACGRADCHITRCSSAVRTAAEAQIILVQHDSSHRDWVLRQH